MIVTVEASEKMAAPAESIFDCVADYAVVPLFIEGLHRLTPTGGSTEGEGARFEALMKVGPKSYHVAIEITEYVENRKVTWASASGESRAVTFELEPDGRDNTNVRVAVTYDRPTGLVGTLVAPVVDETVRARAQGALQRIKDNL